MIRLNKLSYRILPVFAILFTTPLLQHVNSFTFTPLQVSPQSSTSATLMKRLPHVRTLSIKTQTKTPRATTTALSVIDTSILESSTNLIASSIGDILSNENIKQAFSIATFGPQYLWILMVLFPNTQVTKKVMGGYGGIIAFSLVHLFIVIASASQENGTAPMAEFNGVFDPSPDANPQAAMIGMMKYPNFVTEEWSHVLTWDLFVGRWIWLDGLKRGVFTPHSVLLTNLIGPPGFLLHCLTCIVTGKGIVGNEVPDEEEGESETL